MNKFILWMSGLAWTGSFILATRIANNQDYVPNFEAFWWWFGLGLVNLYFFISYGVDR
jgi:hypothetical protein